jgi:hypothetical protein
MAGDYVFPPMKAATGGAGPYVYSTWRVVLHTTEIASRPSSWIPNFQYPSHVVCSFEHGEIFQLLGFNDAGKALYHAPGGVETNRMGAIQIEINGRADEAGDWSQEKLKWIGEKVIKPVCDWIGENGGGFDCYNIPAPGAHGGSASENAPQRMTYSQWINFNGICGHRHVPDNDHYDPDQLNVPQIVAYANAGEDDFMSALSSAQQFDMANRIQAMYNQQNSRDFEALALIRDVFNMVTWNEQRAPEVMDLLRKIPGLPDATAKAVVKALGTTNPGASIDYDRIVNIVNDALKALVLKTV